MKRMKIAVIILLAASILTGCAANTTGLMADVPVRVVEVDADMASGSAAVTDFAVELLKACAGGENTLISPLSVAYALGMTANGADGETLAQMEDVLGLDTDSLNAFLYAYRESLPQGEDYAVHIANSIWFRESGLAVKGDFLETNGQFYNAALYSAAFDDATLKAINDWVKENTNGMIPEILDRINAQAVMYLINALSFDAKWQSVYETHQVRSGTFIREDGGQVDAEFMYASEYQYLEDENAAGFLKYYKDRNYAFAALLPREGMTVAEYLDTLTGEGLRAMLNNIQNTQVKTSLPKFETEYDVELSKVLAQMGMPDAFDGDRADFSRMGTSSEGSLYISRVIHKTYISVAEEGTKAGVATLVEMNERAALPPEEWKEVYLTRPFVYLVIDCENQVPIFIGTMMDVSV